MKNIEKWMAYTQNLFSPDSYKEIGWYFMVGAALQRRVWFGNLHAQPMFPNLYVFLIGPAAIGKGLVLSEVRRFLSTQKRQVEVSKGHVVVKNVIDIGPNDTTYKAYLKSLVAATTLHGTYTYSSVAFILEELETLFNQSEWSDKLLKMLLSAYDCKDYSYETAESGVFHISNTCSSLIGGITPKNFTGLLKKNILTDGFASRTLILIEHSTPRQSFFLESTRNIEYASSIAAWVNSLTHLCGEVTVSPEVRAFVEDWWHNDCTRGRNPKLEGFYGRKRAHVLKLAICAHFSEHTDFTLTEEDFRAAIDIVSRIEKRLEENLDLFQLSEFVMVSEDILRYIKSEKRAIGFSEIARKFPMRLLDLKSALEQLTASKRVRFTREGKYEAF